MKRTFLIVATSLLIASMSDAADIELQWMGHENSTHYRIYQSVDSGATWVQVGADIPQPSPFPVDKTVGTVIQNVPEDQLVLFRASAVNAAGEVVMYHAGAWYDFRLMPPQTSALGVTK